VRQRAFYHETPSPRPENGRIFGPFSLLSARPGDRKKKILAAFFRIGPDPFPPGGISDQ
jgi:hypothetical protein